ncbi:unnamed protein product [Sphagnum compactum]
MDLPAVQVRVIRKVTDLEELIAELTSPYCTLEALRVEKGEGVDSSAFVEGDEIREQFAGALGASKTLKSLDVAFCSDMLKVDDLCMLLQSNKVLESLTVCTQFAESRSFRMMLERNSTLKRLGIIIVRSNRVFWHLTELLTELAGVLRSQSLLEQLTLDFSGWYVDPDTPLDMYPENTMGVLEKVEIGLSAVFSSNEASDNQANEMLTLRLVLPLHMVNSIATILLSNRTIRELVLLPRHGRLRFETSSKDIVILLKALEQNNTLRLLDLSGCSAVRARQDLYDAILNCVETKPWLHLNLQDTPLSESESRFTTIQQKLQQNAKFREAFGNWNQLVNSTGARVFLCGSPRAGKTALRQSLMRSNALNHSGHVASCMPLFSLSTSWAQDRNKGILFHRNQDERTRGIEISLVKDSDIVVSIWDLAGQEEYHAFHDYMMPNFADAVNPCSFLFLFDPMREMRAGEKNRCRKESKVLQEELIYWLQFIASNTPTSIIFPPQLTVILTHADKYLHGGLVEWAEQVVQSQRTTFKDIVNISPKIYALNARSTNAVRPVLDFLFESSQQLLKRMPPVFVECAIIRRALANRAKDCLIKWNTFCDLCIQEVPTLTQGIKEQEHVEPNVVLKRQKAIAANLHDTGDIIYFEGLEFVVVNPNWFCHDVMGFLINFRGIPHESDHGFATKSYMERILAQSLSRAIRNTSSKGGIHLQPNDLIRLMLNLDICYERDLGNLDAGIYIPTILDANFSSVERERIVEGRRQLTWPPFQEQNPKRVFLCRRLECKDRIRTFLTPGFFPRLQVALHNSFIRDGILSADFKLNKGLITLNFKGIDVFVESSGDVGYYIDVLVRSSWNHDKTMEIIEKDIVRVIHETTHKCRGVWLVQSILRPQCVQELTLLKYRKDQVVAMETLKQELFMLGSDDAMKHCYTWRHVVGQGTNGQEIIVLETSYDPIIKLLGEKETIAFMEWRRSQLEEVSSRFKLVEESTTKDHEEHVASSSNFHAHSNVLRRTPSGFHDSTLANIEGSMKFLKELLEALENRIIKNQEVVGERIIEAFKEEFAQMKKVENELQQELSRKLDALMEFTVQLQQRRFPRIVYFIQKEGMTALGKLLTCDIVPGLRRAQLHLMCEHIHGFHDVEGQKGWNVKLESKTFHKIRPLLEKGLQVLSILLKVGAQLTVGLASQVPMLTLGSGILRAASQVLPDHLATTSYNPTNGSSKHQEVADKWLVDTLKCVPDIGQTFDLHKVMYSGQHQGQVAWVCGMHVTLGLKSKSLRLISEDSVDTTSM